MNPCCPDCGRSGTWTGQTGLSSAEIQQLNDHYRCGIGHTWQVTL